MNMLPMVKFCMINTEMFIIDLCIPHVIQVIISEIMLNYFALAERGSQ